MNQYETLFFNNPEELKKKIKSLVEKQLETKEAEECAELKEISKHIDYCASISETVSFECDNPYDNGSGDWDTVEEYLEAKEQIEGSWICSQAEAERHGVYFGGSSTEYGSFEIEGDREVKITHISLNTDTCSVEAEAKAKEIQENQKAKARKHKIQELEEQLLKLKAEQ